ncbi:hypothetical protein MPLA_760003 [Mesorhizobium sp. ORS 3359]|nr:hypothetical protein MPLA_760003 [Mesorhizobium sp. ORS 3359]
MSPRPSRPGAAPLGHRVRDRPHQGRAPDRQQLSCRPSRLAFNAILAIAGYNLSLVLSGVHRDEHPRGRNCECIPFVPTKSLCARQREQSRKLVSQLRQCSNGYASYTQ